MSEDEIQLDKNQRRGERELRARSNPKKNARPKEYRDEIGEQTEG